jgi:hypothetical protein
MNNIFDVLCCCLSQSSAKRDFRKCEGFELMLLMLKSRCRSRLRAIRVLNYATLPTTPLIAAADGTDIKQIPNDACEAITNAVYFVRNAAGIKTIFPIFMQEVMWDFFTPAH